MDSPPSQVLREPLHPVSQSSPTPGTTPVNNNNSSSSGNSASSNNNNSISTSSSSNNNSNLNSISVSSNGLSALGPHGTSALAAHAAHAAAVAAATHAHNQAILNAHSHHHGHNPLNLISKSMVGKPPGSYSSPPPMTCHPENNVCKLIEYRGAKVAAFMVDGRELICLPQAFELFLKHLVGGLHTVYTKLKRLDITPVVCNVEQVRILRGLGAIQPGVNRCKLISCKEFDILYDDCTNSNARPGRPPKRSPSIHASPETLEKLKKSRMDGADFQYDPRIFGEHKSILNGFPPHPYALSHLPFLPLTHPMMSPPVSMAMASHLAMRPDNPAVKDRAVEQDILARQRDERFASLSGMYGAPTLPDHHVPQRHSDIDPNKPLNLQVNGHLKDTGKLTGGMRSDDDDDDDLDEDKLSDDDHNDDLDGSLDTGDGYGSADLDKPTGGASHSAGGSLLNGEQAGMTSLEAMLVNIQGLIKMATETAKHHERQIGNDKAELKIELMREREHRQALEKQLQEEQKNRIILQRRLRKEKKARRRLQEQSESGTGSGQGLGSGAQSVGLDLAVKLASSPESSRTHLETGESENEAEKGGPVSERERKLSESSDGRGSHRDMYDVFSAAAAHASNNTMPTSSPVRFPYMSLVSSEVQ